MFISRKRTMDSSMLKEGGEKHSTGMWRDFLSCWCCLYSLLLCYLLVEAEGEVIRATPPHHNGVTASSEPHSTSRSVEQRTTALPGPALKTLKSWTLLKECIVLSESLEGPERKRLCWFCPCCWKIHCTANVLDTSFQGFVSLLLED